MEAKNLQTQFTTSTEEIKFYQQTIRKFTSQISQQELVIAKLSNYISATLHRKADEHVMAEVASDAYLSGDWQVRPLVETELEREFNRIVDKKFSFFGMQVHLNAQDRENLL